MKLYYHSCVRDLAEPGSPGELGPRTTTKAVLDAGDFK